MTDQTTDLEQSTVPSSVAIAGRFSNLQRTDRIIAEISVRPRWPVYVFTGTAVLVAWVWIFVLAAGVSDTNGSSQLGPGMSLFGVVFDTIDLKASQFPFLLWVLKICTPSSVPELSWAIYFSTLSMWVCMSLAMMLPSALPLIRTYSDIADVAAAKGEGVVSVGYLLLGYMVVWGLFCIVMSVAQLSLVGLGIAADPIYPIEGVIGGLLLIIAGIYQFSELKNACLEKCRNPFSYLFGKWSQEKSGVTKLGWEQGIFCLGCCWALMLVMLVVGTMNLAWMALFTLFAIVEKSGKGKVTSHVSGAILSAWGIVLLAVSAIGIQ